MTVKKADRFLLTKFEIDSAEIKSKDYFLIDGDGLYLRVYPSGSKYWIVRMTVSGRSIQKSLGSYPEINIAEARRLKNKIKEEARLPPSKLTLRQIADKWLHEYSEVSAKSSLYNHKLYVSYLGPLLDREIGSIARRDLVDQLKDIQKKHSYDTARRVAVAAGQIYQHAVNSGLLDSSPASTLSSALIRSEDDEEGHFSAVLSEEGIGVLLRSFDTIKTTLFGGPCSSSLIPSPGAESFARPSGKR